MFTILAKMTMDATGSAARFRVPQGIAVHGADLYVSDTDNFTIRMVVIATPEVTTLAGSAETPGGTDGTGSLARFFSPRGIATDGINIYVADVDIIRSIVIATGAVTTLAGEERGSMDGTGAAARFNQARGIAADCTYVYVAGTENNAIRLIR